MSSACRWGQRPWPSVSSSKSLEEDLYLQKEEDRPRTDPCCTPHRISARGRGRGRGQKFGLEASLSSRILYHCCHLCCVVGSCCRRRTTGDRRDKGSGRCSGPASDIWEAGHDGGSVVPLSWGDWKCGSRLAAWKAEPILYSSYSSFTDFTLQFPYISQTNIPWHSRNNEIREIIHEFLNMEKASMNFSFFSNSLIGLTLSFPWNAMVLSHPFNREVQVIQSR